ncbi:MAG TPA: hypothetical protein VGL60_00445 [Acidimicrobiales bacterium]|jgi:hypothetical protein
MARHLAYEIGMWRWSEELMPAVPTSARLNDNALIEVCLLHTGNLIDFFVQEPTTEDTILAPDYVSNWVERTAHDADIELLRGARTGLTELLSHLSTQRLERAKIDACQQVWVDALLALGRVWSRFLGALSPERRAWFTEELSRYPTPEPGSASMTPAHTPSPDSVVVTMDQSPDS